MDNQECKECGALVQRPEIYDYCDQCIRENSEGGHVISKENAKTLLPAQKAVVVRKEMPAVPIMPTDMVAQMEFADHLAKSGMFPGITDKYQALAVIEHGRVLRLHPTVALNTIVPINGRLSVEAKVYLALLEMNGTNVEIIKKDKKGSKVKFSRKGKKSFIETFTFEDAEAIKYYNNKKQAWVPLATKANWISWPEEMCFWKCIAKGAKAYDPRSVLGLYTKEELLDGAYEGMDDEEEEDKGRTQISVPAGTEKKKTAEKTSGVTEEKAEKKKEDPTAEKTTEKEQPKPQEVDLKDEKPQKEKPKEEPLSEGTISECVKALQDDFQIRFGPEKWRKQYQSFKEFLLEFQKVKGRLWVAANEYQRLSLSKGKAEDLKLIIDNISLILGRWKEWEKKKKEEAENAE